MNASSCSFEHLKRIYETLSKRGVNVAAKDMYKRTALHYAVISGSIQLVELLLTATERYNPNEVDVYGHTPLSLLLEGKNAKVAFYDRQKQIKNIFMFLVKAGADVNFIYPDKLYKPDLDPDNVEEDYDPKGTYKTTLLINVIR